MGSKNKSKSKKETAMIVPFNDEVPTSLGISAERSKVIEKVVQAIVEANHSDAERIERLKTDFPRHEELLYAVYLISPTKNKIAEDKQDEADLEEIIVQAGITGME